MTAISLLVPALRAARRNLARRHPKVMAALVIGGMLVALLLYYGLFRFLAHVAKAPMLGPIIGPMIGSLLVARFLEMIYLSLFFMVVFSSIIAAFSSFYLDDEIRLLMAAPIRASQIFWSRFLLMLAESSWMVVAFFTPIFFAFASALNAPGWAYLVFPVYLGMYLLLPNILGGMLALTLSTFFPIRQMRKVFQFLSALVLAAMIIFFRFLEPEKLLNPKYFSSISSYILNLRAPALEYFPSVWIQRASLTLFEGDLRGSLVTIVPLALTMLGGLVLLHLGASFFYLRSWQASLEAVENQVLGLEWIRHALIIPFRWFRRDFRVVAEKEVTIFMRDPAIFSQIFMMAAIVFVYGYNLTILPLKDLPSLYSGEINDSMVFFNGPFIGFILAAIAMRFVYPSISLEGRAFWAVKASPLQPSRLMWVKFFFYLVPILGLGLILCFISNQVFRVTNDILFWLSYINVSLMAVVITALAIGLGALYARFDADNPLKIAGSFGGFVFMILSAIYVINLLILEAYPIFRLYFLRFYPLVQVSGKVFIILSFFLLIVCTMFWVYIPLIQGKEAIERYEPD